MPSSAHANDRSGRHTILLVEDEPFVREATCSILENAGFSVLPAADASAAMRAYEGCNRPIDLVMTDMVLPGRTGQQLGDDLRQRSPEVNILITSGYGDAEYDTEDPIARRSGETIFAPRPDRENRQNSQSPRPFRHGTSGQLTTPFGARIEIS